MPYLQATWTPHATLFFWSTGPSFEHTVARELPSLRDADGQERARSLAIPGFSLKRHRTTGFEVPIAEALPILAAVGRSSSGSTSIRAWVHASLLALELAVGQRAVPSVRGAEACWRALLNRRVDVERFDAIVAASPALSRALPTRDRGAVRLQTAAYTVRDFVDRAIDSLYRQGQYPGTARGWPLEFADALRNDDASFALRNARDQAVPDQLAAWSSDAGAEGLKIGFQLLLPGGDEDAFPLVPFVHPADAIAERASLADAWTAGRTLAIGRREFAHPSHFVLRGLARAARIHPDLQATLAGTSPKGLTWTSEQAWSFLSQGVGLLEDAGYEVAIPEEFREAGQRRIRARMRVEAPDGELDLEALLTFRWEVVLGDHVIDGTEFAELVALDRPIVQFKGAWVLLDPAELERMPKDLDADGRLSAADALRAVLIGEHNGIPVAADHRLKLLLQALRSPPEEPLPQGLLATLRPYQREGYSWLTTLGRLGLGACLADDMGLGKTVQVIAHLLRRTQSGKGPHLVVCPTSVLGNWLRELRRFGPSLRVLRYHGLDRDDEALGDVDVVITTYGLLVRDAEVLGALQWDVVALDEAQAIKNPDSQRAKAARQLTGRHRVAMSGTPVENRLDELWSLMQFLVPGLLGPRATFRRNVAVPIERFGDETVAHRLKLGVSPFLLRRLKTDPNVITDLPEKLERVEYCPLTPEQARLYREVVEDSLEAIRDAQDMERRGRVLAMLTALKQVCNHPAQYLGEDGPLEGRSGKLERVTTLLEAVQEAGERTLIFTQYREMGNRLTEYLMDLFDTPIPFLHGGTPAIKREEMVRAFQEADHAPPVLIVSLRAGGTGLNLTRATHVVHYDRWWNPAVEDQATDRAYRIGQRENVQVHKLVCQGTLEERIDAMLEEKRALAEQVVGGGERWVAELDDDALRILVALGDDAVLEG